MSDTLVFPDGRVIPRPFWLPTVERAAERRRLLAGRFFVLRIGGNDGVGEVWRCRRCKGRHGYLTVNCKERPFNGLDQVLYAVCQQAGDLAAVRWLDPSQQRRHAEVKGIVQAVSDLPDVGTSHPEMARQMAATGQLEKFDIAIAGVKLGRAEEIPVTLAQRLLDRVNQNQPIDGRLQVEGLVS